MPPPLVTAITVTYNYGRFLARTLDSALAQEYPAECLEIVVVDDGSTDDTPEILADYGARYPGRIKAFRQDNAGYVAATNRAFAEASGQLWAFLDADDLWPPAKVRIQADIFEARPEVGAVYGDLEIIDAEDQVIRRSHWEHDRVRPLSGSGCLTSLLCDGNVAGSSSIMVRASLRERFAPVPAMVPYVDWWTVMQAAAVSELAYIREPRVGYRTHGSNLTFGASGMTLAREKIKQAQTRRAMIVHGGAASLPPEALEAAWAAFERDAIEAVQAAGTVFIDMPRPGPAETDAAKRLAGRAVALHQRGRIDEARRTLLVAAAMDPFALSVRELRETVLGANQSAAADMFENCRSFVALAELSDLRNALAQLRAFCNAFDPDESLTLFVHAAGVEADEAAAEIRGLLNAAGINEAETPHMVLQPDPNITLDRETLCRLADLVLVDTNAEEMRQRFNEAISAIEIPAVP